MCLVYVSKIVTLLQSKNSQKSCTSCINYQLSVTLQQQCTVACKELLKMHCTKRYIFVDSAESYIVCCIMHILQPSKIVGTCESSKVLGVHLVGFTQCWESGVFIWAVTQPMSACCASVAMH